MKEHTDGLRSVSGGILHRYLDLTAAQMKGTGNEKHQNVSSSLGVLAEVVDWQREDSGLQAQLQRGTGINIDV